MSFNLSDVATRLISDLGYWGLAAGLVIDSLGAPIPSEVLVPIAVVAASSGRFQIWAVIVVAIGAQLVGALISYAIGRRWGLGFVVRVGSYLLISERHVELTERLFARHGGWITAAGRCMPVVRGFIGYPAGAAAMKRWRYVAWTILGTAVWTTFLVIVGKVLSAHLHAIDDGFSRASTLIAALLAALIVLAALRAWRRRASRRGRTRSPEQEVSEAD